MILSSMALDFDGELKTSDPIADIPQRRGAIPQHGFGPELDVLEQQHTRRADDVMVGAIGA